MVAVSWGLGMTWSEIEDMPLQKVVILGEIAQKRLEMQSELVKNATQAAIHDFWNDING